MSLALPEIVALAVLGVAAGAINAVAGGGSLITFPALVAFGVQPLTANVSNTIAQLPGYLAISNGYRPELEGQRPRIMRLLPAALIGGGLGVALLKLGSASTFRVVAPALILIACLLLIAQPRLRAMVEKRSQDRGTHHGVHLAIGASCAYAAYFGAAAGVLLLAVLAIFFADSLQRLNALNRFLVLIVNLMAATLYTILGPVNWVAVAVLGPTTALGGHFGVGVVRRFSTEKLRWTVIGIGLLASAYLIVKYW